MECFDHFYRSLGYDYGSGQGDEDFWLYDSNASDMPLSYPDLNVTDPLSIAQVLETVADEHPHCIPTTKPPKTLVLSTRPFVMRTETEAHWVTLLKSRNR